MNTATPIKQLEKWRGHAVLYKLSLAFETYDYVIVSSVIAPYSGPETYIFGSDAEGNVLDWSELTGSERGDVTHDEVLSTIDYCVVS